MIPKPYFVMLTTKDWNGVAPLVNEAGEVCQYETENEAFAAGGANIMGAAFGFEVFEIGGGVCFADSSNTSIDARPAEQTTKEERNNQ